VRQVRIDAAPGQSPGPVLQSDLLPLAGHLGTSLGAVDAAGQVQEAVATDAFGQLRIPGSPANPGGFTSAPAGGWQQSHLFAGEYWDQDSQLLYLRARWYDPQIGRFISADPFEGKQTDSRSLNRYAYSDGDPVRNVDPTGEFTVGEMNVSMGSIAQLSSNVGRAFATGARGGWQAIRALGQAAEKAVENIVKQCLRPKPGKYRTDVRIKGSKRRLDGLVDLEQGLLSIETKASLPKLGSKALQRLKEQLLAAQKAGHNPVVVSTTHFTKEQMREVLKYLGKSGVNTSDLKLINGLVHFAAWIGETYGVVCLGL
jgi:RHS repeat-associated protein